MILKDIIKYFFIGFAVVSITVMIFGYPFGWWVGLGIITFYTLTKDREPKKEKKD